MMSSLLGNTFAFCKPNFDLGSRPLAVSLWTLHRVIWTSRKLNDSKREAVTVQVILCKTLWFRLCQVGCVLFILFLTLSGFTQVRKVPLSLNDKYPASRWEQGQGEWSPKDLSFQNLKKHWSGEKFEKCINEAKLAQAARPSLTPWIRVYHLLCAEAVVRVRGQYQPLAEVLNSHKSSWLYVGPYKEKLRQAFLSGLMTQLEEQGGNGATWETIGQLESYRSWLSGEQKARLWSHTGELALKEKKNSLARDFFERSLKERESKEVRKKWLLSQLNRGDDKKAGGENQTGEAPLKSSKEFQTGPSGSLMTEGEKKLFLQMKRLFDSGNVIRAVSTGVKLIKEYPGGEGAGRAGPRIGKAFVRWGKKRTDVSPLLQEMLKSDDSERLYQWAYRAYRGEMYPSAYQLALKSYKKREKVPLVLRLLGLSAFHANKGGEAIKYWNLLSEKYSASEWAEEIRMRLGLLYYRNKKNKLAASYFEKAIAASREVKYEVISRYWLWRSQERLKSGGRARELGLDLMNRFPLTYYGLRARMELAKNQKKVLWPPPAKEVVQGDLWLTERESQSWERFKLLLQVGWFEEAQEELLELPEPKNNREKLLFAKLSSLAFDHHRAIALATQAWETSPRLLNLETLRLAYPMEYLNLIEGESKKYNLDPLMVMSLIKQESSFRKEATSVSCAMGLMQLMKPTARDVARQLRKKIRIPSDLFHPPTNIQLGTRYLRQMIRAFKGHIPLALAAYNTGIGHMRIWLRTREELGTIQDKGGSHPDDEIWMDELPWAETSYYVKAILRNYILYKALDKKEMVFHSPLWLQNE